MAQQCHAGKVGIKQHANFPSCCCLQGAHVRARDITVLAGCGSILDLLFFILADEGACVGIPAPYYPAFDRDLKVMACCASPGEISSKAAAG